MIKNEVPIISISGVGGAGKNSIMEVFKKHPEKYSFFVSYTDRPQRKDDVVGESYHFLTKKEFDEGLAKNEFMEWEQTRGEYRYGRKKKDLEDIIKSGRIPVMNIDVKGAIKFKNDYKVISFFIVPPSREEAIRRMRKRGSDSEKAIQDRIDRYDLEYSFKDRFDHVIVNDDLKEAQEELLGLVEKSVS